MTMLVVGLYDQSDEAQKAVDQLKDEGFKRSDLEMIEDTHKKDEQGFFKSLFGGGGGEDLSPDDLREMGISRDDASFYTNAVHDGKTLLIARCESKDTERVRSIMAEFNLSDYGRPPSEKGVEKEGEIETQTAGSMPGEAYRGEEEVYRGPEYAEGEEIRARGDGRDKELGRKHQDEEVFEEVEEEVRVGKGEVESGGVRVSSEIHEEPVEEEVHLKEEHVDVERRPVDREVSASDESLFQEEELEFSETREEPIVEKTARVKEEVVVGKEVEEHTETIRETARSKEVKVEDLYELAGKDTGRFEQYESDFESDYNQRYADSDQDFDNYTVGYRYGMALAEHEPYRDRRWEQVEPEARESWEAQNKGTWDEFKDAVKYGWNRIRGEEEQRPRA